MLFLIRLNNDIFYKRLAFRPYRVGLVYITLEVNMPKQIYICYMCGLEKEKYPSLVRGIFFYCSYKCRNEHQKTRFLGEDNPNFNNKWSEEKVEVQRSRMIERMKDPEQRYVSGKANRGKTLDKDKRKKMSISRLGKLGKKHSDSSKRLIGQKSAEKWTSEYKDRNRFVREMNGSWIPKKDLSNKEVYYHEANWICRMFDIVDNEKFIECGVWNYKNNPKGLVRDHKYSRISGFKNKVFPEILRHPFNCNLILHSENITKSRKNNGLLENSITLEELFNGIIHYKHEWKEQSICIQKISDYKNGLRWKNLYKKEASK